MDIHDPPLPARPVQRAVKPPTAHPRTKSAISHDIVLAPGLLYFITRPGILTKRIIHTVKPNTAYLGAPRYGVFECLLYDHTDLIEEANNWVSSTALPGPATQSSPKSSWVALALPLSRISPALWYTHS
ncbi:hypothetical protein BDQ17DRAFT_1339837, partial [Cyathus striatus]